MSISDLTKPASDNALRATDETLEAARTDKADLLTAMFPAAPSDAAVAAAREIANRYFGDYSEKAALKLAAIIAKHVVVDDARLAQERADTWSKAVGTVASLPTQGTMNYRRGYEEGVRDALRALETARAAETKGE